MGYHISSFQPHPSPSVLSVFPVRCRGSEPNLCGCRRASSSNDKMDEQKLKKGGVEKMKSLDADAGKCMEIKDMFRIMQQMNVGNSNNSEFLIMLYPNQL